MEAEAATSSSAGKSRIPIPLQYNWIDAGHDSQAVPEECRCLYEITFEFRPIREPGLCILFFAAEGIGGKDLFDPSLPRRTGEYKQYHSGAINALHVSYFRRKAPTERAFHVCNLRKSKGFHLVAQGADPIASVADVQEPYRIALLKKGALVKFSINELPLFEWTDDGKHYGPVLAGGRIGFRQMAPLVGEYANLQVRGA